MLKTKTKIKIRHADTITMVLLVLFVSVLLANATISGVQAPISIILAGALSPIYSLVSLVGYFMSAFLGGNIDTSLVFIVSIIVIVIAKFIVLESNEHSRGYSSILNACITSASTMLSGTAVILATDRSNSTLFIHSVLSLGCGLAVYYLSEVIHSIKNDKAIKIEGIKSISYAAIFVLTIALLGNINIFVFNAGRIVGAYAMMFFAKRYKNSGGAIIGILTTCGLLIFSKDIGMSSLLLGLTGLILGAFCETSNIPFGILFVGISLVCTLVLGGYNQTINCFLDSTLAACIFIVFPGAKLFKRIVWVNRKTIDSVGMVSRQLDFSADAISEVKNDIDCISKALEKKSRCVNIPDLVCEKVCRRCRNNIYCWEQHFDVANNSFNSLSKIPYLELKNLPTFFDNCFNKLLIVDEFNRQNKLQDKNTYEWARLRQIQGIVFQQSDVTETILRNARNEVQNDYEADQFAIKILDSYFRKLGASSVHTIAWENNLQKLNASIYCSRLPELDMKLVVSEISTLLNRDMNLPEIIKLNGSYKVNICEATRYSLNICASQTIASNKTVCGDNYDCFYDGLGYGYILLSDGMGTGDYASIDSRAVILVMKKYLRANMGIKSALDALNSLMLVKSADESFATLDCVRFNLFTGETKIVKLGSAITYVKCTSGVEKFETSGEPIGIMSRINPKIHSTRVKRGDTIVLTTDGISEDKNASVYDCIGEKRFANEGEVLSAVVGTINEKNDSKLTDDTTIITASLVENNKFNIVSVNRS